MCTIPKRLPGCRQPVAESHGVQFPTPLVAMMAWRLSVDEMTDDENCIVPDDVVDLSFRIDCAQLPIDHARDLYHALAGKLAWLRDEPCAAVHSIFDAASGNGWMRPAAASGELMQLSKRTRLYLRLPQHRVADATKLHGHVLDVGGHRVAVGAGKVRALSAWQTIFARSVVDESGQSGDHEAEFSGAVTDALAAMNIRPPKLLCGLSHSIRKNGAAVHARSVMLADLPLQQSIRLQQNGLGTNLKIGCGIFLPHKSITSAFGSAFGNLHSGGA